MKGSTEVDDPVSPELRLEVILITCLMIGVI